MLFQRPNRCRWLVVGALACGYSFLLHAQNLSGQREVGESELRRFTNKQVVVDVDFVKQTGPEDLSALLGLRINGCPSAPLSEPPSELTLAFETGRFGPWAGDLDGINVGIKMPSGETGNALAIPSINTIDIGNARKTPRLDFWFDGTLNVERALIDRVAKAIDACLLSVPPGQQITSDIIERCDIPVVERSQVGQTCVQSTYGTLEPRDESDGLFDVVVNVSTMCDFVGMGRSANRSTGFTTCYSQEYRGSATVGEVVSQSDSQGSSFNRMRKKVSKAFRQCKVRGKNAAMKRRFECVKRRMMGDGAD